MSVDNYFLLGLARLRKRWLLAGDPVSCQQKILLSLVRGSAHTRFGRRHDFSSIRTARDFLGRVMPNAYRDLKDDIDRIMAGEPDILFPGQPECFGITSGTSGPPKVIPLTRALLGSTRRATLDAALLGGLQHGSLAWNRGKILYIGPRKGRALGTWTIYAEGTAFTYRQPFTARFVPSYEMLPAQGVSPDFSFFLDLARRRRITAVAGNPLEIVAFIRATGIVMSKVKVVFNCGYWANDLLHLYRTAFPNATVVDVYSSNEGTYGLPGSPGEFLLNYRRVFFSFLPLEGINQAISIGQVVRRQKYRLCVTTPGGLWNYVNGDVISFIALRPPVIRLHGRDHHQLSLGDDWLTEDEVVAAVRRSRIRSLNYFLTPKQPEPGLDPVNCGPAGFVLHLDSETADETVIDRNLGDLNPTYARLRTTGALAPLTVCPISATAPTLGKPVRIRQETENETVMV